MKKTIGAGALLVSLLIVLLTALPAAAISEHPLPASSFFAPSFTDDNKMTTQAPDDYPSPTSDFFVNDFASCLTDEDKSTIQALGEELYKKTKAQVVVVTVQSLGGRDIESYSIGLAREWGIGDKDDDSGVLLLLSTGDRQVRIEVGKGLEGSLTDGKSGRILDSYAVPYLKNSDYSTGLRECYKKLVEEVYSEYGVEGYTSIDDTDIGDYSSSDFGNEKIDLAVIIIIMVLVLIILILPGRIIRKAIYHGGGDHHGGGDYHGGGFYGGGFGGHSSGGFSGGSSSGGFSGGGGGFSGGGSSRGF